MTTREIEFDPDKAAKNWKEHKVMFDDAALVLLILRGLNAGMIAKATRLEKSDGRLWARYTMFCLLSIRSAGIKRA
jgi:uncharacterized DUF497 family protein